VPGTDWQPVVSAGFGPEAEQPELAKGARPCRARAGPANGASTTTTVVQKGARGDKVAAMRGALLAIMTGALVMASPGAGIAAVPPVKHVFVIVLENKDAADSFGADSPAPYLAHDLRRQGVYVPNYYGIGHVSLDNYVAMLSGQAPNPQTQSDCQFYTEFLPGTIGPDGQATGQGCVYPSEVKTLADQLRAANLTWKGYMEDMGKDPARDGGTSCAHPALNARDQSQTASATDQYAARHNPFVYFHSIIDTPDCAASDVPLDRLSSDLTSASSTPSLSFITPDLCNDGHDATCADGGPGGLKAAGLFLQHWVPKITRSPAFRNGLLIVTFDESESDSTACCNEQPGPNTPSPGGYQPGPGGGKVGAVLVSPFIAGGTMTTHAYNHSAFLRSVEDIFGLSHLAYAAADGLRPFGDDVYNAATAAPVGPPARRCHSVSLARRKAHLKPGTILRKLRVLRSGHRRFLAFTARHSARLTVRSNGKMLRRRLRPCHSFRIKLPSGARCRIRVTAATRHHAERRTLRLSH
jgi:hypothetical protein